MPDGPPATDGAHERAVLERHLLRPGAEHVFPGLWWGDRWIPGVEVGDTWMPAWSAPGMPMLRIPVGFGPNHVVAALGIETSRGLLPHQRQAWDDAHEDPEQTWRDVSPMPIDDPFLTLQTSPVLDLIAQAHGEAPQKAQTLCDAVTKAAAALRALHDAAAAVDEQAGPGPGPNPVLIGSLARLVALDNNDLLADLAAHEVASLIAQLERSAAKLASIAEMTTAILPRHTVDDRYAPWSRAAARLDALVRGWNTGKTNHAAIVAALEWHGHDLGSGSLDEKKERVRGAIKRRAK
jgi:hypothetical protein